MYLHSSESLFSCSNMNLFLLATCFCTMHHESDWSCLADPLPPWWGGTRAAETPSNLLRRY